MIDRERELESGRMFAAARGSKRGKAEPEVAAPPAPPSVAERAFEIASVTPLLDFARRLEATSDPHDAAMAHSLRGLVQRQTARRAKAARAAV